jgi:hypothetical protein
MHTQFFGAMGEKCVYAYYDQNTNRLYLRNDAYTAWLGGFSPGWPYTIENSYVKLDCRKTTVFGSGNTITIKWNLTFKSAFLGTKNIYLKVVSDSGAYSNWVQKGSWTIQSDTTPPIGAIKINNASAYTNSTAVTLNLSATDPGSGMGTGAQMQFSNDSTNWSTPEAYATTKSWFLPSEDGTKAVYAKFKDVAGNWSTIVSDTIILDTIAPEITGISPSDGTTFYGNDTILISSTVNDTDPSPLEYQFSIDGIIKQPWSSQASFIWTQGSSGSHNLKIEVRDAGGQDSEEAENFIFRKPLSPP